jgi:hypothetical protein
MKTQYDIKKLEDKLNSFLMSNDVKIGIPISKKAHSPLLGYEYDTISVVMPSKLITTLFSWLRRQGLENMSQHEIEESGYIRVIIYF